MSGKVNIRFIAIAGAVLAVLFAAAATVGYMVLVSTPQEHIARGEKLWAEGKHKEAITSFGHAVNKDPSSVEYLDRYIEAIRGYVPPDSAELTDKFRKLAGAMRQQAAVAARTDVDRWEAWLAFMERVPGVADPVQEVGIAVRSFQLTSGDDRWKRLLRYRGKARVDQLSAGREVDTVDLEQAEADLRAALEADPSLNDAAASLHRLLLLRALRLEERGERDRAQELAAESERVLAAALERAPQNPTLRLAELEVERDPAIQRLLGREPRVEGSPERVGQIADSFKRMPVEAVDARDLVRLLGAERRERRSLRTPHTRAVVEDLLARGPDDARLLLISGVLDRLGGDFEGAWQQFQKVVDLPQKPISAAARMLETHKTDAMFRQGGVAFTMWEHAADNEHRQRALEQMRSRHAMLKDRVPEDAPQLLMSRARIAFAEGDRTEASRLLSRHASMGGQSDEQALWMRAQLAAHAGNWTEARTLLESLVEQGYLDMRGGMLLADAMVQTQDIEGAVELYERMAATAPEAEFLQARLRELRVQAGVAETGDPFTDAVARAQQAAAGSGLRPGDRARAVEILRQAEREHGPHPRLSTTLAEFHVSDGDLDGARETLARAAERFPDDERLRRSLRALEGDTPLEVRFSLIDSGDADELSKLLVKHTIAMQLGEREIARRLLDEAAQRAPDDGRVIENLFNRALRQGNLQEADRLAARATELNIDGARGLALRAQVQLAGGDLDGALASLERAVQMRPDSAQVLRLLGQTQRAKGRSGDALSTYQRALEKRGNDPALVQEYVALLQELGRNVEALTLLRDNERLTAQHPGLRESRLVLEAQVGERARALESRTEIYRREPDNLENAVRLAELLIEDGKWADARRLIDRLRERNDELGLAILSARWHADRGDLDSARKEFTTRISDMFREDRQHEVGLSYLALGEFLISRGQYGNGIEALRQATRFEDPQTLRASRRLAERLASSGAVAEAAEVYQRLASSELGEQDRRHFRLRAADMLIASGRLDEAEQALVQLGADESEDVLLRRAEVARQRGDVQAARQFYSRAIERAPRSALPYLARANFAMQVAEESGNRRLYADAREDLNTAIELDRQNPEGFRLRWLANMALGERDRAMSDLRDMALAGRPNPNLIEGVVQRLVLSGRGADATAVASRTIEKDPTNVRLRQAIVRAYLNVESVAQARQWGRELWERARTPDAARLYVETLMLGDPRPNQAQEVLSAVRDHIEDDPSMLQLRARVLSAAGRGELAKRDLLRAWRLQVDRPHLLFAWNQTLRTALPAAVDRLDVLEGAARGGQQTDLVRLFRAQALLDEEQRRSEGVRELDAIIASSAESYIRHAAVNMKGQSLLERQRPAEAATVWRNALSAFPNDWQLHNNAAFVMADELDRAAEAVELARRAVELAPDQPAARDTLGWVLFKAGEFDEAERELEVAMRGVMGPLERPGTALRLAKLKAARGDSRAARDLVAQVESLWRGGEGLGASDRALLDSVKAELDSLG